MKQYLSTSDVKKQKYYPESYKDSEIPFPHESGRPWKKWVQAQNESEFIIDENGEISYPENNNKAEIKHATGNQTAYDREKELLEAIDNSQDDNEIPERVEAAEKHNELKELFDSEENKKYKKYDKYKDYQEDEETRIELWEVLK